MLQKPGDEVHAVASAAAPRHRRRGRRAPTGRRASSSDVTLRPSVHSARPIAPADGAHTSLPSRASTLPRIPGSSTTTSPNGCLAIDPPSARRRGPCITRVHRRSSHVGDGHLRLRGLPGDVHTTGGRVLRRARHRCHRARVAVGRVHRAAEHRGPRADGAAAGPERHHTAGRLPASGRRATSAATEQRPIIDAERLGGVAGRGAAERRGRRARTRPRSARAETTGTAPA